jgi:hypothetical protein
MRPTQQPPTDTTNYIATSLLNLAAITTRSVSHDLLSWLLRARDCCFFSPTFNVL